MSSTPKLSVHIVTYNHASFIAQALDSVLMQKFPCEYEILIGDDCSSDGTAEIIKSYHRRFPEKIRPVLREKNLGPGPNAVELLERCTGEYIAFLEGDDYWIDTDKLRLQLDYLEQNPDCALVHHRVRNISWPSGVCLAENPRPRFRIQKPPRRTLAMVNYIQTCSVMFRRKCLPPLDAGFRELKIGDWPLFVLLSQNGWIGFIDKAMAEYRIHSNNNWNCRGPEYKVSAMAAMAVYLAERVNDDSKGFWHDTILALALKDAALALRSGKWLQFLEKTRYFLHNSRKFHRPFWLLDSLWPYYRANYSRG